VSVSTEERRGRAGERDDESSSPSRPGPRADDGPSPRPSRRSFSPEYKLGIVAEYEAAPNGEKGAILRREGLYSSHVIEWTRARTAVVVDDGIATGSTAQAACEIARAQGARRVVLAVPVVPPGWESRFQAVTDELVCLATPYPFDSIGRWYRDFRQTRDEEVLTCLDRARAQPAAAPTAPHPPLPIPSDGTRTCT